MTDSSDPHRTALVTGASRGIGLALAHVLARHGHDLVLTARSEAELKARAVELEEDHGVRVQVVPADLAEGDAPARIHRASTEAGVAVDIVVNNAGFGSHGLFHEQPLANELEMLRVNVEALTHLTGLFLPDMVRRGRGGILQIASTAAFQPAPLMSVYYASKAYVLHFSEALAEELRGTGVTVTTLCPGPVRTGFQERADMQKAALVSGFVPMLSAERVAEAGYRGLEKGKRVVVPGLLNKLGVLGVRFAPRSVATRVAGRLNRET